MSSASEMRSARSDSEGADCVTGRGRDDESRAADEGASEAPEDPEEPGQPGAGRGAPAHEADRAADARRGRARDAPRRAPGTRGGGPGDAAEPKFAGRRPRGRRRLSRRPRPPALSLVSPRV